MKGTTAKDAEQKTEGRHIRSTAEGDGGHICVDAASSETSSHEVTCQTTEGWEREREQEEGREKNNNSGTKRSEEETN